MTTLSSDCELIADYAIKGSEAAFRALVARHVDLVFATAFRQVGDAGIAEEITQNVFVTLARKSPRLGGVETLAGWLHRAAILESKARIRSELRRKRREEVAAEAASVQREGESPLAPLIPLLDEALLNLREGDRLALVLRFLENRNLCEVGTVLGVDEDAARKRVSRALDRLAVFFRKRGFAAAGAASTALFAEASKAAPASLAASAAAAGLGAGGAVGGWGLVLFHLMALTKIQTAVICALIVAAPVGWEWHATARATSLNVQASSNLELLRKQAADAETETERARKAFQSGETEILNAQNRLTNLEAQRLGKTPKPIYHWDDNSALVRVPKKEVLGLELYPLANSRGQLNDLIKDVLQISEPEANRAQEAISQFISSVQSARANQMRRVEPTADELQGHAASETRVFEFPAAGAEFTALKDGLFAQLEDILGPERAENLERALKNDMPFEKDPNNLSSAYPYFLCEYRLLFYQPKPGDPDMLYGIRCQSGSSMSTGVMIDDIPDAMRPFLQDWIALARKQGAQNP